MLLYTCIYMPQKVTFV